MNQNWFIPLATVSYGSVSGDGNFKIEMLSDLIHI